MIKITIVYKDGSTRIINSEECFLNFSKVSLTDKLERLAFDTGKVFSIRAEYQNKEIFKKEYPMNTPQEFINSKRTSTEKLEAREYRRKLKNQPLTTMLAKVSF